MQKIVILIVGIIIFTSAILFRPSNESKNFIIVQNLEQFKKEVENKNVVIYFGAEWCGPCHQAKPRIKAIAEQEKKIKFLIVDIDKLPSLIEDYGVNLVPQLSVKNKKKLQGLQAQEVYHNFILKEINK